MPPLLSQDLRDRVVRAVEDSGPLIRQAALRFEINPQRGSAPLRRKAGRTARLCSVMNAPMAAAPVGFRKRACWGRLARRAACLASSRPRAKARASPCTAASATPAGLPRLTWLRRGGLSLGCSRTAAHHSPTGGGALAHHPATLRDGGTRTESRQGDGGKEQLFHGSTFPCENVSDRVFKRGEAHGA